MNAEFIAIVTVGLALAGLILHSNRQLQQDLARLRARPTTGRISELLRCGRCSESLPRNQRGPSARLCKKCRKSEQNRRSYQRRKAKSAP